MLDPIVEVMAPLNPYKMNVVYLTALPLLRAYNSLSTRLFQTVFFSVFISDLNVNGESQRKTVFFIPFGSIRVTYLITFSCLKYPS